MRRRHRERDLHRALALRARIAREVRGQRHQVGPGEREAARELGEVEVVADAHADPAPWRLHDRRRLRPRLEEQPLAVPEVDLAIDGQDPARADHGGRVVERPAGAQLAEPPDDDRVAGGGFLRPGVEGRAVRRLGAGAGLLEGVEDVARRDQLREHDDLRARRQRLADGLPRQPPVPLHLTHRRADLGASDADHAHVEAWSCSRARAEKRAGLAPEPAASRVRTSLPSPPAGKEGRQLLLAGPAVLEHEGHAGVAGRGDRRRLGSAQHVVSVPAQPAQVGEGALLAVEDQRPGDDVVERLRLPGELPLPSGAVAGRGEQLLQGGRFQRVECDGGRVEGARVAVQLGERRGAQRRRGRRVGVPRAAGGRYEDDDEREQAQPHNAQYGASAARTAASSRSAWAGSSGR